MKIVLDTNVLIAAFISPNGICSDVFELCIRNHSLIISDFILNELKEKLELKFLKKYKNIDIISPRDFYNYEKGIS